MRTKSFWSNLTFPPGQTGFTYSFSVDVKVYLDGFSREFRGEWAVPRDIDYPPRIKAEIDRYLNSVRSSVAAMCFPTDADITFIEP